jgi:hydroxymethylpyrimidine pyrophosphatase-like HAD family hydrolase
MKFANFTYFQQLFEETQGDPTKVFREVAKRYIEETGTKTNSDAKADFVVRAADSVASLVDPSNKIKKASRELSYDPEAMSTIKNRAMENLSLSKTNRSFELLWDSFKKSLNKLSEKNSRDYEKIVEELVKKKEDRKVEIRVNGKKYNLLKEVKTALDLSPDADEFLEDLYNLKIQIGKNPSGKGEYFLDFLIKDATKGSDVRIGDEEYELKTTGGAIGEPLGSKPQFLEQVKTIFLDRGDEIWERMSFGKKDFWNWAEFFVEFTSEDKNKDQAKAFLQFHCAFNLREVNQTFIAIIEDFVNEPKVSSLINFYNELAVESTKSALRDGFKSMIIFEEKTKMNQSYWTGDVYVFEYEDVENVVVFAGSKEYEGKVRVGFSKGNNTGSRPDISGI